MVATLLTATACTSGSGGTATASPAAFSGSGLAHAKAEAGEFEESTAIFPVRTQKLGGIASPVRHMHMTAPGTPRERADAAWWAKRPGRC